MDPNGSGSARLLMIMFYSRLQEEKKEEVKVKTDSSPDASPSKGSSPARYPGHIQTRPEENL